MTDRALANAEKRRDEVAARINQLNQDLEEARRELNAAETFIKEWHRFAEEADHTELFPGYTHYPQMQDTVVNVRITPKNPDRAVVGRHALDIITEFGHPVSRRTLFEALAERGIHIHGKDPEMVLSTMLWRMKDDFVRLPGFGYWKARYPWEDANYLPGNRAVTDAEDLEIEMSALLERE